MGMGMWEWGNGWVGEYTWRGFLPGFNMCMNIEICQKNFYKDQRSSSTQLSFVTCFYLIKLLPDYIVQCPLKRDGKQN